jgi:hypothetical protein
LLTVLSRAQYHFAGIVLGLAIYNGVYLELDFAPALYKKLLALPLGFDAATHCYLCIYADVCTRAEWTISAPCTQA